MASLLEDPVISSAALLMNVILPSLSVVKTPSAMLFRMTLKNLSASVPFMDLHQHLFQDYAFQDCLVRPITPFKQKRWPTRNSNFPGSRMNWVSRNSPRSRVQYAHATGR